MKGKLMSENIHVITDAPEPSKKARFTTKTKIAVGVAVAAVAAGAIALIKVSDREATSEEVSEDSVTVETLSDLTDPAES
jgi:hypothetical protein